MWDGREAVEFEPGAMREGITQSRREAAERQAMSVQKTRAAQKIERIFEETGEYPEDVEVTREELDEFRAAVKSRSTALHDAPCPAFERGDVRYTDVPIVLRPEDMTKEELQARVDRLRQTNRHPRADAVQFDDGGRCRFCEELVGGDRTHRCWKWFIPVNVRPEDIRAHHGPPVGNELRPELQKALHDAARAIMNDGKHPLDALGELDNLLGFNWDYHDHMLLEHSAAEDAVGQLISTLHCKLCELYVPQPPSGTPPPLPPALLPPTRLPS
jgi:hypothetical protein